MTRLRTETDDRGCRTLWLDRPEKRNALDEAFLGEILKAATDVLTDPAIRLVVLRSSSPIFCAGADLNDYVDLKPGRAQKLSLLGSRAFQQLADLPVPVVAVLEGAALGGGFELALAADLRIATRDAKVGFPEARLGNTPAWGGVPRLAKIAGVGTAKHMLLTGDPLSAEQAFGFGIVQRICDAGDLPARLAELIDSILACEGETLAYIKAMFGNSDALIAAQEASLAGFTSTRPEASSRKEAFLASRRRA